MGIDEQMVTELIRHQQEAIDESGTKLIELEDFF
jgi:hypothetical protein